MATPVNEMKSQLARYLSGQCSLEEFEEWFAPVLRDVHKSSDQDAEALAHAIEWAFCDLDRGVLPESVRSDLLNLVEEPAQLAATTLVMGEPLDVGNPFYSWNSGASTRLHVGVGVSLVPQMRIVREREFA